ncbi:Mannose-P-dolichol utilization defect 1 protein-like [Symbiodinium microadriaticum]|uniref:Mannose-P-dolichol utilization defect 1 protein homolog n=1 Tax=Symbiodinium microadriaticum TaxID=2951 RepID=A0A1Q9CUB0_SYMMI|nr:Mannose-P-dolichol utilization defect 1 protein-like [Symbiodinium microadriaticum]
MPFADVAAAWLGYAVIAGACVVKLPQIYLMVKNRSAEGLSETSAALDAIAASSFSYYNLLKGFPISGWGEQGIVAVQATVVLLLIWVYREGIRLKRRFCALVAWLAMSMLLLKEGHKEDYKYILVILGTSPTFMTAVSRIPQIFLNWQNGRTGQLSAITFFLQFLGSVVRFLTTLQIMGKDVLSLVSHATGAIFNLIVVLQIYSHSTPSDGRAARPCKAVAIAMATDKEV